MAKKNIDLSYVNTFGTFVSQNADVKSQGKTVMLNISDIIEDPLNKEIYGEHDIDGLTESIKEDGLYGVSVMVYPVDNGKYMIASGHRRVAAAKNAGMTRIPVLIIKPPKTEAEHYRMLVRDNLHARKFKPTTFARHAEFVCKTCKLEYEEKKKAKDESADSKIIARTARMLEISESKLYRYRSLLNLIPELQELADNENYNWSAISAASTLSKDEQRLLYDRITDVDSSMVTGAWIARAIDQIRMTGVPEEYTEEPAEDFMPVPAETDAIAENVSEEQESTPPEEPVKTPPAKKMGRPVDRMRSVLKARDMIKAAIGPDASYKSSETAETKAAAMELIDLLAAWVQEEYDVPAEEIIRIIGG